MTRHPDFDELVGQEPAGAERERLRRVHELLVAAGPPPELSPQLEAGPTLGMTLARPPRAAWRRRVALLAAAAVAIAVVFLGGFLAANRGGGGPAAVQTLSLRGTSLAPGALASLRIQPADAAGNWPMRLSVTGLPALPKGGHYEVYLVRGGKPWGSCGTFVVAGRDRGTTVTLNAPYRLQPGDTWVVTRSLPGETGAGQTVLAPSA